MMGTNDWQQGMPNVTMATLASVIDDRGPKSQSGGIQPPRVTEQIHPPMSELPDVSNLLPPHDPSQPSQVKVFLNPLVILLARAEKQKGRPLICSSEGFAHALGHSRISIQSHMVVASRLIISRGDLVEADMVDEPMD